MRLSRLASFALLLSPLSCGTIIGLDQYEIDEDGGPASGGNGSGGDGDGGSSDGGSSDGGSDTGGSNGGGTGGSNSGGTGGSSDGGSDTGGNGTGGGSCESTTNVVLTNASTNNGSFELGTPGANVLFQNTDDWEEEAEDVESGDPPFAALLGADCPCATQNSGPGSNDDTQDNLGSWVSWLGGVASWNDWSTHDVELPPNALSLRIQANTNFQTSETTSTTAYDRLYVTLIDLNDDEIVEVANFSNLQAQTETDRAWTTNGLDETVDVEEHADSTIRLEFASTNDSSDPTDFILDDVRITVTVCDD